MWPLPLFYIASFYTLGQCLWPIPRQLQTGFAPVKLSNNFTIAVILNSVPQDLVTAVARTEERLKSDAFERLVVGRASADADALGHAASLDALMLSIEPGKPVRSIATEVTMEISSRSESYVLTIPASGQARLTANSTLGLFRGLATFEQLWYTYDNTKYLLDAPIHIIDQPSFPYRSFSLDTARNFYPVSDILRTLDAMSWVKLSTLYWHVADSQSFPLTVPAFPELASKGAYSQEEIYSVTDVKNIVQYANARGIDVVMELDTPGHTMAVGFAHPEHVACANKSPWSKYASEPPAGQLRIASNTTVEFVEQVFRSVLTLMTSPLISTGGDEVNLPCWQEDRETAQALAEKNITIAQALNNFVVDIQGVLKENKKTPFIKSDMILTHNVPVTNDTVAVVWQSSADAAGIAQRGLRLIHQPSDYFYLDCGAGDWVGNNVLANSWCDPFKTWQRAYSFDPYANLTAAQYSLVLGGQMPLWSEQSSPENLDSIVWPRLAVAAEVFWTGATLPDGTSRLSINATSGRTAFNRLNEARYRLVDRGVKAIALQPKWCVLRPGECDVDA